jgi:anti-anti-sigma regulatory factor
MPMTIAADAAPGDPPVSILTLAGELDASNFERLIEAVREAWDGGARALVLDLSALTFMASSGLVALYSAVRIFRGDAAPDPEFGWQAIHDMDDERSEAGNVRLAGVQAAVERVLERTGLGRLFHIDPTAGAAVAALQGG